MTVIKDSSFSVLFSEDYADREGIVLLGTGGSLQEWIKGVVGEWRKNGIVKRGFAFTEALKLTTSGGRTDLVLFFDYGKVNVGALTLWRLRFGDCSWLSDYRVNYRVQHIIENEA